MGRLKSKKPVVIDYKGIGMLGLDAAKLNKDNLWSVNFSSDPKNIKIKNLDSFWRKLDDIDIWSWKRDYNKDLKYEVATDQLQWTLLLRSPNSKVLVSKGEGVFPDNFNEFGNALNDLFENEVIEIIKNEEE